MEKKHDVYYRVSKDEIGKLLGIKEKISHIRDYFREDRTIDIMVESKKNE